MTPAGARRPASHGVFAIEEEELLLPDPIALDTSFVVETLIATQPLHVACRAFLDRIDAKWRLHHDERSAVCRAGRGGLCDRAQGALGKLMAKA